MDGKAYKWIHLQSPTFFFVLSTLFSSVQFGPKELKVLCVHLLLSACPPSPPISLSHSTFLKIYRLNWKKVTRSKGGAVESHNLHASLLQWWQTFMLKIFLEVATFLQLLSELFPRVLTLWGYVFIFFLFFQKISQVLLQLNLSSL